MPGNTTYTSIDTTGTTASYINITGEASWNSAVSAGLVSISKPNVGKISVQLYFKYVKSKISPLRRLGLDKRIKNLEKAFLKAVDDGQDALSKKMLAEFDRLSREALMMAKGVKYSIELEHINKYKRSIKDGGHISDTLFGEYTRVIPSDVLKRKKEVEDLFDSFVIYHYFNKKQEDVKDMGEHEKAKMRDPILFGRIANSNRLYFIADWEDEYCTLTFDEIVDHLALADEEVVLKEGKPDFS